MTAFFVFFKYLCVKYVKHFFQLKYISKSKLPKKGSAREEMTMSLLRKFTDKLRSVPVLILLLFADFLVKRILRLFSTYINLFYITFGCKQRPLLFPKNYITL